MKTNYFLFIMSAILVFSCERGKDIDTVEIEEVDEMDQVEIEEIKNRLSIASFVESFQYDGFSERNMTPIEDKEGFTFKSMVNFRGKQSNLDYMSFEETIHFEAFLVGDMFHWIPVYTESIISFDTTYIDYQLYPRASFSSFMSLNSSYRKKDEPLKLNKLKVGTHISITDSKFISRQKIIQLDNGTRVESAKTLEPAGCYGVVIDYTYESGVESDQISLYNSFSGREGFTRFLSESYNVNEEIEMLLLTEEANK